CICPLHKWGSQCLLDNSICNSDQNTTCYNNGQCIPIEEHMVSERKFICICRNGFSEKRCEIIDNKIILSFHKDIILPQTILVHFIQVIDNNISPENGSSFKNIPINKNSITIRWSHPFHIASIELSNKKYYLIIVQETYNQSINIVKTINPSDRCEYISEILNETIAKFHLIR
ncbi:unnamed protein product, partial [Rotaria sp. Silwood1]